MATRTSVPGDERSTPSVLESGRGHAKAAATAVAAIHHPAGRPVGTHPGVLADREGRPLQRPGRDHEHEAHGVVDAGDDRQDGHTRGDGEAGGLPDRDGDGSSAGRADHAGDPTHPLRPRRPRRLAASCTVRTLGAARRDPGDLRPMSRTRREAILGASSSAEASGSPCCWCRRSWPSPPWPGSRPDDQRALRRLLRHRGLRPRSTSRGRPSRRTSCRASSSPW